ncbi:uncharacterized protein LOC143223652 isoform X4 [Tachypleus tridentatus]|uniref:uncharacterized protein LOC143223652 isoform X4 n=1 Tax=Tachypleus tridentatus TaxID=6853 RepID=UPI003FD00426
MKFISWTVSVGCFVFSLSKSEGTSVATTLPQLADPSKVVNCSENMTFPGESLVNETWKIKLEKKTSIMLLNVAYTTDVEYCEELYIGYGTDPNNITSLLGVFGINNTRLELATLTNDAWIKIVRSGGCMKKLQIGCEEKERREILNGSSSLFMTGEHKDKIIFLPSEQDVYCILRTRNSLKNMSFSVRWKRLESHKTTVIQEVSSNTAFPSLLWEAICVCFTLRKNHATDSNNQINETYAITLFKLEMTLIAKTYALDRNMLIPDFSPEDIQILDNVTDKNGEKFKIVFVIVTKEDNNIPIFSAMQLLEIINLYQKYFQRIQNVTSDCSCFDVSYWMIGGIICSLLSAFIFILIGWGKYVLSLIRHWKKKGTKEYEQFLIEELSTFKPTNNREDVGSYVDLVNDNPQRCDEEENGSSEVQSNVSYQTINVETTANLAKRISFNFEPLSTSNDELLSNDSSHKYEDSETDEHIYEKVEFRENVRREKINDRPTNQIFEKVEKLRMNKKPTHHASEDTEGVIVTQL